MVAVRQDELSCPTVVSIGDAPQVATDDLGEDSLAVNDARQSGQLLCHFLVVATMLREVEENDRAICIEPFERERVLGTHLHCQHGNGLADVLQGHASLAKGCQNHRLGKPDEGNDRLAALGGRERGDDGVAVHLPAATLRITQVSVVAPSPTCHTWTRAPSVSSRLRDGVERLIEAGISTFSHARFTSSAAEILRAA